jgi:hypothetical protein
MNEDHFTELLNQAFKPQFEALVGMLAGYQAALLAIIGKLAQRQIITLARGISSGTRFSAMRPALRDWALLRLSRRGWGFRVFPVRLRRSIEEPACGALHAAPDLFIAVCIVVALGAHRVII